MVLDTDTLTLRQKADAAITEAIEEAHPSNLRRWLKEAYKVHDKYEARIAALEAEVDRLNGHGDKRVERRRLRKYRQVIKDDDPLSPIVDPQPTWSSLSVFDDEIAALNERLAALDTEDTA